MIDFPIIAVLAFVSVFAWNRFARAGYESADYKVVQKDGDFEVREYPDLKLAATSTSIDARGRDGSFMKLFRYISGANESDQKISMTTPVFMENDKAGDQVQMGFVMPKDVAVKGVPTPTDADVDVQERKGGRFAVLRFSGRLKANLAKENEKRLRVWMDTKGFVADETSTKGGVEVAAYDPPFTPGPLRRNEVLIRLK